MFLASYVTEGLGPIAPVESLVGHGTTLSLPDCYRGPMNIWCLRADRNSVYTGLGTRPETAQGKRSRKGAFNGTVVALGLTSFFTDISSEMVAAVIPLFLTTQVGFGPSAFGLFQGAWELSNALLRLVGGVVADRTRRLKETAAAGYGLSMVTRIGLVFSAIASFTPVPFLLVDRLGKGLRTSPRDAMISIATPEKSWGTAFGFHRTLDAAGALLGPLLAFGLLAALPGDFNAIFVLSVGFALVGLAVIVAFVRNPKAATAPTETEREPVLRNITSHWANRGYRRILLVGASFGLFSIGDGFIYLIIFEASKTDTEIGVSGFGFQWFPLLFAGTAVVFLATATPLGRLADRVGRARVWVGGQLMLAAVYGALLFSPTSVAAVAAVLALLGLYYGATDGVLPALAAGVIPTPTRSSGLGLLSTVIALSRLVAALGFGLIWERVGVDSALIVVLVGVLAVTAISVFSAMFSEPSVESVS